MTQTTAPATSAARTRAIKHQLAQLDLAPTIRSYRIGSGTAHTVFTADAEELDLVADVLDALGVGCAGRPGQRRFRHADHPVRAGRPLSPLGPSGLGSSCQRFIDTLVSWASAG
jgi:hypothetical protein